MRMWMVPPYLMCRQHLLGEHRELHTIVGCFKKGTSIKGYLIKKLIDPSRVMSRHEELVREMYLRGYNHKTPLTFHSNIINEIDPVDSLQKLIGRCPHCTRLVKNNIIANLRKEGKIVV